MIIPISSPKLLGLNYDQPWKNSVFLVKFLLNSNYYKFRLNSYYITVPWVMYPNIVNYDMVRNDAIIIYFR